MQIDFKGIITAWAVNNICMKSYMKFSITFILLMILTLCLCACDGERQNVAEGCIRIHIRANSNSDFDQSVKLHVRDAVTEYLTLKLENCTDKRQATSVLESEKENLKNIADRVLKSYNMEYKASVLLKNEHFPKRVYGEYTFPEGDYDALIINLGTGEGNNWWCVAFPPLCFVPDSTGGESIVYKSWIKEILDKLFSQGL